MAQVVGGTLFDLDWERSHNSALETMASAADIWASRSREALSSDAVLAGVLRIYLLCRPGFAETAAAYLDASRQPITNPNDEIVRLRPNIDSTTLAAVLRAVDAEISIAIGQWVLGHPEQPPTTHFINAIEHILFTTKLTHRPSSPKLPRTLTSSGV